MVFGQNELVVSCWVFCSLILLANKDVIRFENFLYPYIGKLYAFAHNTIASINVTRFSLTAFKFSILFTVIWHQNYGKGLLSERGNLLHPHGLL